MSQAPSTLGTMITLSLSPISPTSCSRSSRSQGLSSELTRVQRAVWPQSDSFAAWISPPPRPLCRPAAGRLLAVDRHRVLQVAEQDVRLLRDRGRLGDHLRVREVEEMD